MLKKLKVMLAKVMPLSLSAISLIQFGCASGFRPCSEGGDVSWPNIQIKEMGDQYCLQSKIDRSGPFVNEGRYRLYDKNAKLIIEGEFRKGQKHGNWVQYDPSGKRILEKFFDNGTEIIAPEKTKQVEKPEFSRMKSEP